MHTDVTIGRLNSHDQELSNYMLNLMNQYLRSCVLMNVVPSRDAVDDQFQLTLDMHLTSQYDSQGQQLSNDMLNLMN